MRCGQVGLAHIQKESRGRGPCRGHRAYLKYACLGPAQLSGRMLPSARWYSAMPQSASLRHAGSGPYM